MNPCLRTSRRQLGILYTASGKRSLYDSAAHCTRCGSCTQACPIYRLLPRETASPRGRNQFVRLLLERKIKPSKQSPVPTELLHACTLCGHCTQACPGNVPTAEHVLEIRRALHLRVLPRLLFSFLQLRETRPRLFATLARTALLLRHVGLVKLLRLCGLTRLPGLQWVKRADELLPQRTPAVHRLLRKEQLPVHAKQPSLVYVPSLEAEFILPHLAVKTLRTAQQKQDVTVWFNTPSGLFSYIYGDVRQSRRTLRRLIRRHAHTAGGKLPLLTDSLDVYNFLKRAPQLFSGKPHWEEQARQLATCVKFVTDIFPEKPDAVSCPTPVRLEYGTVLDRQSPPVNQAETILYTLFGKNFVECWYTDADVPAFGYAFTQGNRAEQIGLEAAEKIKRTQTKTVFTLSGLSALELSYFLRRLGSATQVKHLVDLIR